jgi:hypothetical protein
MNSAIEVKANAEAGEMVPWVEDQLHHPRLGSATDPVGVSYL